MPRKSTGSTSVAGGSTPSTPISKAGPRKSSNGTSTQTFDSEPTSGPGSSGLVVPPEAKLVLKQQETALKGIEAFELPRSNIIKVAKSDIPDTVQLRKEVQQALVKSATVFISYLTATAHEGATKKGGKIISAQHVLDAVKELELETGDGVVLRELKDQLKAYRENMMKKKTEKSTVSKNVTDAVDDAEADGDVSRFDAPEDELDESMRHPADEEDGGDESLLRKSLHNGLRHNDGDDDDDDEGADQLMDED